MLTLKYMNKQTIVSLIVIILGVTGLVLWSKSVDNRALSSTETKSHPARIENTAGGLKADNTFYDFGTISMKNGNVSKIFTVTNPTAEDITVPSLYTSCMCTKAYIVNSDGSKKGPFGMPGHGGTVPKANETIKAGSSVDIEVVYDPNAHGPAGVGLIERAVFLEDENRNVIEYKFKVNVTP